MHGREVVERADDFIHDVSQQLGRFDTAGARFKPLLGNHPAPKERRAQHFQGVAPLFGFIAEGIERRRGQLGAKSVSVDNMFDAGGSESARHQLTLGQLARLAIRGVDITSSALILNGTGRPAPPLETKHRGQFRRDRLQQQRSVRAR